MIMRFRIGRALRPAADDGPGRAVPIHRYRRRCWSARGTTWLHWALAVWLLTAPNALAQVPLQVMVDGHRYLVTPTAISAQDGGAVADEAAARKVNFTARVLDEQILHSEFNQQLFNAANRAVIYRDQSSGRLLEPWRRSLPNGSPAADAEPEAALLAGKTKFKEWAARLASNPRELALAIVRKDYRDGIAAYRDNVAIYRKVQKQNQTLTYNDALAWMRNEWLIMRLALARTLEERLSGDAAETPDPAGLDQANVNQLRARIETEIINRIDSDARTADDLDASDQKIREIVYTSPPPDKVLGDYLKAVTELTIQFELWAAANTDTQP
jgi:hypothetical protein